MPQTAIFALIGKAGYTDHTTEKWQQHHRQCVDCIWGRKD